MTDQTARLPVRRALISVSDKTGILEFARELQQLGVEILSTGGTYKLLKDNGVNAVEVADYTGFAEMMDGRVKTLHPKIHGGILGRRGTDDASKAQCPHTEEHPPSNPIRHESSPSHPGFRADRGRAARRLPRQEPW